MGDPNGPWPRRGGEIGAGSAPPRPPPAPSQAGGAVGRGDRAAERSCRAFRSRRWGRRLKRRGPPAKAVRLPAETARPGDEGGMVAGQNGEAPGQEGHARHARRTPARFGKARSGVAGRVTLRWKGMTWQRARCRAPPGDERAVGARYAAVSRGTSGGMGQKRLSVPVWCGDPVR